MQFITMKHSILLFLFAGILFFPAVYAMTPYAIPNETNAKRSTTQIVLKGEIREGGFRSGTDPIIVEQQGQILYIKFQKDVGILFVTITGAHGIVYSAQVNTSTSILLSIPLENISSGNYTISFNNENGMIWGEFER